MISLCLEKLSGHSKDGVVCKICKCEGDEISSGDMIIEIESNKGNSTVTSKASGKINCIKVKEGDKVKIGDILAEIDGVETETKTEKPKGGYYNISLKPVKKELESDLVILGGGPGGYVAAIQGAKKGLNVILVEKEKLGGTCLNWGCIPTKALVASSHVYKTILEAGDFGMSVENVSFDMNKIIERKENVVNQLVQGIEYLMEKNNVKVIYGTGEIVDANTVAVNTKKEENTIKAKNIIIASGSKISTLPIPGMDSKHVITSKDALGMTDLPEKLVIVGGGIIGMEFAFIYANLGLDVSVVEYFDTIINVLDEDVCSEITSIAKAKGIKLFTGSRVESIADTEDGKAIVKFNKDDQSKFIIADKVLVAVGREPFVGNIKIEELGIELNDNKKGIKVNDYMQTSVDNIYAIGDVTNKIQLAHVASHQGLVAIDNIIGKKIKMDYSIVPSAIFTDPEIACIGLSEKDADKEGIEIEIGKFLFAANGKALTMEENKGFVKVIKEKNTDRILGATIIGIHATDLIAEIALAVKNNLTVEAITETIHAHPTTAEAIHEAALDSMGCAIHQA